MKHNPEKIIFEKSMTFKKNKLFHHNTLVNETKSLFKILTMTIYAFGSKSNFMNTICKFMPIYVLYITAYIYFLIL